MKNHLSNLSLGLLICGYYYPISHRATAIQFSFITFAFFLLFFKFLFFALLLYFFNFFYNFISTHFLG